MPSWYKEQMKPCPFCGGAPVNHRFYATRHTESGPMHVTGYGVFCPVCRAAGPKMDTSTTDDPESVAIEAWNKRQ